MINKLQKDDMQHALGIDREKKPYRNYYCDYSVNSSWEDLIKQGYAALTIQKTDGKKYYYYSVTLEGQKQLGLKGECAELGCQNKFNGYININPNLRLPMCRKHYYQHR